MAGRREKGWKEGRRSCFLVRPQGGHLSLMVHRKEREEGERKKVVLVGVILTQTNRDRGWNLKKNLLLWERVLMWGPIVHSNHTHLVTQLVNQSDCSPACQTGRQPMSQLWGFIPVSWRLVQFHNQDWRASSWQVMGFWICYKETQRNKKMHNKY